LTPLCVLSGVLLLKRHAFGYLLSSSSLIILITIGLSVVAGEIMLGRSTGQMNTVGVIVFCIFVGAAIALLYAVLAGINKMRHVSS
jgi:hypothetical protein